MTPLTTAVALGPAGPVGPAGPGGPAVVPHSHGTQIHDEPTPCAHAPAWSHELVQATGGNTTGVSQSEHQWRVPGVTARPESAANVTVVGVIPPPPVPP